jgi:hypothetical protein
MSALDILLAILLTAGLALSVPVWWWLFGEPVVQGCKRLSGRKRISTMQQEGSRSNDEGPHAGAGREFHKV